VVFIPSTNCPRCAARGLLPQMVPHADAAAKRRARRTAVAALTSDPSLLLAPPRTGCTRINRRPAMPLSLELMESAARQGIAATISGPDRVCWR